ncbi:unnamed protein product [Paramecium sonneborni]|uniref:Uncharacterized protein n=1 Tax=Paramecium sonneborni TaxID=65129 RepID=A0A8S1LC93_9CILI|nr:unnamed protein product [Paramecium sonneborni]
MNIIYCIEEQDDYVYIKVTKDFYYKIIEMDRLNSRTSQQVYNLSHKFLRRVVPFFMNQFLIWSKDQKDENMKKVCEFLEERKKLKNSKQQKFELGDLKFVFSKNQQDQESQYLIKMAWKSFLNSDELRQAIKNNKKMKEASKENYAYAINLLLNELDKPSPYSKFLSINKYQDNIRKKIKLNTQLNFDEEQFDEEQDNYENSTLDYPQKKII